MFNNKSTNTSNSRRPSTKPTDDLIDIDDTKSTKEEYTGTQQQLSTLVSKSLLISASIEEHINRRLARIINLNQLDPSLFVNTTISNTSSLQLSALFGSKQHSKLDTTNQQQQQQQQQQQAAVDSLSCCLTTGSGSDGDSHNEDFSDEGLDTSQRIVCDNLLINLNDISVDDTIVEANIRLQQCVDKVINLFEESSKQLIEANNFQAQLVDKLEESQSELDSMRAKCGAMELEFNDKFSDLQKKLINFEGLADAYENDIKKKKETIMQLEENLNRTVSMLNEARTQIETEKSELNSLESVNKDLMAQRDLFTNDTKDEQLKGKNTIQ